MDVNLIKGDITTIKADALVIPTNSHLTMGSGLAGDVRREGGEEIRLDAQRYAPVPIGKAVITKGGRLSSSYIIHVPIMERPGQKVTEQNIKLAMRAALACAEWNKLKEIAIPGLASGGVSYVMAADSMAEAIKQFHFTTLNHIILVAFNDDLYYAFQQAKQTYLI